MIKVLHITAWYPNKENPLEAVWIKNQIDSLSPFVEEQSIYHLQVKPSKKLTYFKNRFKSGSLKKQTILEVPTKRWFFIEFINFIILFWNLRIRKIQKGYDIINFHIAYPQLVYWNRLKKGVKQPVIITEHWSGYHFNFGLSKKIPKIQNIFGHNIPIVTVSKALASDIESYYGKPISNYIIPNVINSDTFYKDSNIVREDYFFMVSQWKEPKKPAVAIKAFDEFNKSTKGFKLKIGGFGPLLSEMKKLVSELGNENIEFLGSLDSTGIASHMRKCKAFLHPSEYETFSVVCAEARSCGAPSIVSNVGGIPEVFGDQAIFINDFQIENWSKAMSSVLTFEKNTEDHNFSSNSVGRKYFEVLKHEANKRNNS